MENKKANFLAILKKYFRKDELWLVPNILCYVRVFLIILFLCFYLIPFSIAGNPFAHYYISCAMLVLAAYTDFLDGFIARKFHQTSELGRIIDPISDKMLQCAGAAALCVTLWEYPLIWAMFGIFVFKEFIMFLELFIMAADGKSFQRAHWYGKLSTFVFYLVLGCLIVVTPFLMELVEEGTVQLYVDILCSIAIVVLAFALVMYLFLAYRIMRIERKEVEEETEDRKS